MTQITLELPSDLEAQLRSEAAKQGLDPNSYIVNALRGQLLLASESEPLAKSRS